MEMQLTVPPHSKQSHFVPLYKVYCHSANTVIVIENQSNLSHKNKNRNLRDKTNIEFHYIFLTLNNVYVHKNLIHMYVLTQFIQGSNSFGCLDYIHICINFALNLQKIEKLWLMMNFSQLFPLGHVYNFNLNYDTCIIINTWI